VLRRVCSLLIALGLSLIAVAAQAPVPCAPVGTPTCSPSGVPIGPPAPPTDPVPPTNPPGGSAAPTINAVTGTIVLGGGRDVRGAQGMALDPNSGLVYIGLNGNIVAGCDGDVSRSGPAPQRPGAHQMSIVDPSAGRELRAVPTGTGPIWPTVDPARRIVYMAGSGSGKVTVHDLTSGDTLSSITVGGLPHAGGLDYTTRLMVVGNTVRTGPSVAEQNHASVIDTATGRVVREFETSPAPHGIVVDQDRHLTYFTAVGDGAIVVVNSATGQVVASGVPKSKYGTADGNNNLLARQAATRRLFQVNAQPGATGILVVDEVTLTAESVIAFGTTRYIPWGMWVDEPNRLLFAALPNAHAIGIVDLDSLAHVGMIPVGSCPYAVVVDPERRIGLTSNQGTPSENTSASIFDLCPVYAASGRPIAACSSTGRQR
jgi:hypothetical protein